MIEEKPESTEQLNWTRPGLLYHGTTGNSALKIELMSEYGLFASIPTLTPSLELALDHASGGRDSLLTFWYPKKQEVLRKGSKSTKPRVPISKSDKETVIDKIQKSQIPYISKDMLLDSAKSATALLPNSRLGAVALLGFDQSVSLRVQLPHHDINFLQIYSTKRVNLTNSMKEILDGIKIYFFAPDLNTQILADDMIKTDFEHYLLNLSRNVKSLRQNAYNFKNVSETWLEMLSVLRNTHFPESIYERYRQMLVNKLEEYLQK